MNRLYTYICRHYVVVLFFIATLMVFSACKSSKSVVDEQYASQSATERFTDIVSSYSDWNSFSTSGKVTLKIGDDINVSSSIRIQMQRNQSIMISLRPVLGIEMARLYVSPDSVVMLDKFNKCYVASAIGDLLSGFPFDISVLQDILINRAFILGSGTLNSDSRYLVDIAEGDNSALIVTPKKQPSEFLYSFAFSADNNLSALNVIPKNGGNDISASYSEFTPAFDKFIARKLVLSAVIDNKKSAMIFEFDASHVKWNSIFDNNITIGKNYKRTSIGTYLPFLKNMK